MTKVSIIVPVYNQKDFIVRALDSIPERDDIEVLVIDDGSTDGTSEILDSYDRIPIKVFHNDTNHGVGYSRNVGIDVAEGEYIYGIDSDDWIENIDNFNATVDLLYKLEEYDMVYVWIRVNNGGLWSPGCTAFHTRFTKRSLIGDSRCPEKNYGEDTDLYHELLRKKPNTCRLGQGLCFYHYNFPREGSLVWNAEHKTVVV